MSVQEIQKLVNKAKKALYDNEKFATGVLAVRAKKVAEAYPTDQTAIGIANFLTKRASAEPMISRCELKEVYSKLYTPNNQLAGVFADELGIAERENYNLMRRDPREGENLVQESYEKLADPLLASGLESVFDSSVPFKAYSATVAKKAEKTCVHELNCTGVFPKKITVVAGQPDVLICQATYETPKGQSHLLIPVEIKDDKALIPTMFLSRGGFVNISKETITDHIHATAGKTFKVDVESFLKTISNVKNGAPEPLGEVERLMMKVNASRETPVTHTANGILYQEVDKAEPNVKIAEYEQPEEVIEFAKRLTSNAGIAEMQFGKDAVEMGRNSVLHELRNFGHNHVQAIVADCNEDTVFYGIAIDKEHGFNIPVKFNNGKPALPQVIVADGGLFEFSKLGIGRLMGTTLANTKVLAQNSHLYNLPASQIVDFVRDYVNQGKFADAEEALIVLRNSENTVAYKAAYNLYTEGLTGKKQETVSKCTMPVKSASSKHVVCGHTNLPLHKVYQDAYGDCHPLYRRGMADTYEGASFLHHKICWD